MTAATIRTIKAIVPVAMQEAIAPINSRDKAAAVAVVDIRAATKTETAMEAEEETNSSRVSSNNAIQTDRITINSDSITTATVVATIIVPISSREVEVVVVAIGNKPFLIFDD